MTPARGTLAAEQAPFVASDDIVWTVGLIVIAVVLAVATVLLVAYAVSPLPPRHRDPYADRDTRFRFYAVRTAGAVIVLSILAVLGAGIAQETTDRDRFAAHAAAAGYPLSATQIGQLLDEERAYTVLTDGTILDAVHALDGIHLVPRAPGSSPDPDDDADR